MTGPMATLKALGIDKELCVRCLNNQARGTGKVKCDKDWRISGRKCSEFVPSCVSLAREHAEKAIVSLDLGLESGERLLEDAAEVRSYLRLAVELMTEAPPCQMFAGKKSIDPGAERFFSDGTEGGKR